MMLSRIVARLRVWNRTEGAKWRLVRIVDDGKVVAVVQTQRTLPARSETDRDDHVEAQARQVDEVIAASAARCADAYGSVEGPATYPPRRACGPRPAA